MEVNQEYGRAKALKAFDDTKAGVKGLVDAGITTLPQIFVLPPDQHPISCDDNHNTCGFPRFKVPLVDLNDIGSDTCPRRKQTVEEIRHACETWGLFQVVNHGIPLDLMDKMIEGVRRFNEQEKEVKMQFYSREKMKKVRFNSNYDLYSAKAANWRDTLVCVMAPNPPQPEEYPESLRYVLDVQRYDDAVLGGDREVGKKLFRLVSEALDLEPSYLEDMECSKGHTLVCHYYPECPEPDRTIGHARHSDPDFLTVLLQDHIGGLQVLHQDHWVDVAPLRGALVVNIGDLLQLMSNDKLKSIEHRVLAKSAGPRISVACFFTTHFQEFDKLYGPIKQLLTDESPALYKETFIKDYINSFYSAGLGEISALSQLRL